ncbi:MAG TPA: WbqC family protein [Bacteroidia bacterium]|nr:WbqC family protein [Bacteroidia bacterium]
MNTVAILPVAYLPPLPHYVAMLAHSEVKWDIHEHFHKQYFYNRSIIYGANGPLKLIIPLHKRHEKTPLKEVKIKYEDNWQALHWRSLEAAYRRSPYFEYFEHELEPLYTNYEPELLIDWNRKLFETVNKLMQAEVKLSYTAEYLKTYEQADDCRSMSSPAQMQLQASKEVKYQQVFQEKYGFISNLSIIDLLFCEGPHAKQLLVL